MRWYLRCLVLSALVATVGGPPARACINDREVNNSEQEFKYSYPDQPAPETPSTDSLPLVSRDPTRTFGALGVGGFLLVGAVIQTARKPRDGRA
jgi:hypothetical protein